MKFSEPVRAIALGLLLTVSGTSAASAQRADPRPGIGRSDADPVGSAFDWPPGLVVDEPIESFSRDHCRHEDQSEPLPRRGFGLNVTLCLGFTNTTERPITVRLPAGLIFVSFDDEDQNGLLIQTETFEVPPGDRPFFVNLGLQCLNIGRAPSGQGDTYRTGPVTEDPALRRLIDQVQGLRLSESDMMPLQNLVWNATDAIRLDPADRSWIAAASSRRNAEDSQ